MLKALIGATGLSILALGGAAADEVYSAKLQDTGNTLPNIVYEDEIGGDATWAFEDGSARFYVEGLAGRYSGRTNNRGWYVVYDSREPPCPSGAATDHLGDRVGRWGRLEVDWTSDDAFVMRTGRCNEPYNAEETIVGVSLAAQTAQPSLPAPFGPPARDLYNFEDALLVVAVNQPLQNDFDGYVSYSKTLPLDRGGAELSVSVQVITDSDYHMIEFMTSGAPSLDDGGGLGYSMSLWPFSSVWNLQRNTQTIYAQGHGLEAALEDLEIKFNGAEGRVDFSATGDATKGGMVLTMKNKN